MIDYKKVSETIVGREEEILAVSAAMNVGKHILLEGPPGTSKSTILRRLASVAEIPFYIIEGNIDLTPAKLIGHFNPAKVMGDTYRPEYFEKGPLTKAMEEGGILYIEEFNRMPADVSNALITPMEEGELTIPRYGLIRAVRPFTVVASQNPYDDVGTVRVSRAFMDRVSLIKIGYQSEEEERNIVFLRTGCTSRRVVEAAVKMVRKTREHPEIKLGASVRAAIDLADIYSGLQSLSEDPERNFIKAAHMSIVNKIWLNETAAKSAEEILHEIWKDIKPESIAEVCETAEEKQDKDSAGPQRPEVDEVEVKKNWKVK